MVISDWSSIATGKLSAVYTESVVILSESYCLHYLSLMHELTSGASRLVNVSGLDLITLRIFVLAAHTRSLTQTSEHVYMTLSAVSKRINELEKLIGQRLFERRPQGLQLTPAGESILMQAKSVVASVDILTQQMNAYVIGINENIRVWANTSSIVQFLPKDLFAFQSLHPDVKILLEERLSVEIIKALNHGDIDVGIYSGNIDARGLEKKTYRIDQLVIIAPASFMPELGDECQFSQIVDHCFIGLNNGSAILDLIKDAAVSQGKSLDIPFQVASFDAAISLIEAGLGISILPRSAVIRIAKERGLRIIKLQDHWSFRQLWIAWANGNALNAGASALIKHLTLSR
ncbi:LysR family transcriptional regulator (plasmid) [Pantoea sp. C3]|uniref:LysR family transcriptional regulator n=1 Tax=Pantoea phytostimulans TaxID=2769024 RepID=UPI0038F79317